MRADAPGEGEPRQRPGRATGQQHGQRGPGERKLQHRGGELDRHQGANCARPAELVAPEGAQRGLRHGGRRHGVGQRDRQTETLDQPAEHVVVGQVVHQGGEPSDPLQRLPPEHHGGAETVLPPHGARQQGAGEEVVVDLHGTERGNGPLPPTPSRKGRGRRYRSPSPCGRGSGGGGREPEARYRPSSPPPHLAPRAPATSRRSQSGATCTSESAITSTSCFAAGSMLIRLATFRFGPCGVGSTTTAMSRSGNLARNRRTTGSAVSVAILHPEHHLPGRIVLPADAGQCLLQQRLVAMQRLEDGHWRHRHGCPR